MRERKLCCNNIWVLGIGSIESKISIYSEALFLILSLKTFKDDDFIFFFQESSTLLVH